MQNSLLIKFCFNIHVNLNCSVRCVNDLKSHVVEGELRSKELMKYLDEHKAKKIVWISEDATAITSKVNYDPITNQLVGILLPLGKNGNPIPFRYFFSTNV